MKITANTQQIIRGIIAAREELARGRNSVDFRLHYRQRMVQANQIQQTTEARELGIVPVDFSRWVSVALTPGRRASLSRTLAAMGRAGLVERFYTPNRVALTDAGEKLARNLTQETTR